MKKTVTALLAWTALLMLAPERSTAITLQAVNLNAPTGITSSAITLTWEITTTSDTDFECYKILRSTQSNYTDIQSIPGSDAIPSVSTTGLVFLILLFVFLGYRKQAAAAGIIIALVSVIGLRGTVSAIVEDPMLTDCIHSKTTLTYTDSLLDSETTYYYKVYVFGGGTYVASNEVSATTLVTGSAITVVSGKAEYVDRTYDETGFTGTVNLPIRYAKAEIVIDGTTTATTTTDASGNYSIPFNYSSGTVYVRVITESSSSFAATVQDNRDSSIYAVSSNDLSISSGDAISEDILAGLSGAGPAFNIYDNIIKAQKTLKTFTSQSLEALTAYWYDGKIAGTYFTTNGTTHIIAILGKATDSDAYDDTVILHEVGHYVGEVYSKDSSPGGSHSMTGHYDLRLTWSEGWATFFGSLVQDITGESNARYYVDTDGSSTLLFAADIELPSYSSLATGADNELSISAMLWDIYDSSTGESFDDLALGYDEIWTIFDDQLPNASIVTFETFFDEWESTQQSGQLTSIIEDRGVNYAVDQYEDNDTVDTARTITTGTTEVHTFFPAGDNDYWSIDVTSGTAYTFKTSNGGDGVDTLLTLYDTDGTTQLKQNDDSDSFGCTLCSRITWTADADKTVYLLSETYRQLTASDLDYNASNNPPGFVQYGYYTIDISSQ